MALLPAAADDRVWEYFATATLPVPAEGDRLLAALPGPDEPAASGPALEAETGPVSYTHLDVYKRQGRSCAR